jgi:NADPH2:quinone reductase
MTWHAHSWLVKASVASKRAVTALTLASPAAASISVRGMRAVEIRTFGRPEGLAVIDLPDPGPADGQVLIATEAIGVGGVDAVIRSGAIAGYGFKEGHILGSEVAGTVTAVGDGVDPSWTGQRVWAFTGLGGGYVEQAIASVGEILPCPRTCPPSTR